MHGDFSRLTFNHRNHFSRVLVQQGRVCLDAEPNEQTSILLDLMRSMVRDLLGPHGVPANAEPKSGFRIDADAANGFKIGQGHYYVNGLLCENEDENAVYFKQPHLILDKNEDPLPTPGQFLVYLDVWERHLTSMDHALMRETALGDAETSSRAQVVWQVKALKSVPTALTASGLAAAIQGRSLAERPQMRARTKDDGDDKHPCLESSSNGFRGPENQLYRFEVHTGGVVGSSVSPTIKWSRDNGSIVFPVLKSSGQGVQVSHLGHDASRSLRPGDWVELLNDVQILNGKPGEMLRVKGVTQPRQVDFHDPPEAKLKSLVVGKLHPFLRRWDHRSNRPEGDILVTESDSLENGWIEVEDGIQIQFMPKSGTVTKRVYFPGDYWLVPARALTGRIEWSESENGGVTTPDWSVPHGVEHHYAPLAKMTGTTVNERLRNEVTLEVQPES